MNQDKSAARKSKAPRATTFEEFDALSDAQKQEVFRSVDRQHDPSEMRPLTTKERKEYQIARRRLGQPVVGKGAKQVAITVERDLLKRSDAFAKRNNLKRSELFAAGVNALMENPKLLKRKGAA